MRIIFGLAAMLLVASCGYRMPSGVVMLDNGQQVLPSDPGYDTSLFCDIADPKCFPDMDGPSEGDDGDGR